MYVKKSVKRAAGNPGIGLQLRDELVLYDVDDIAYMPSPDDKGVVISEDIVMKPGKYAYSIYMTQGTVEVTSAADGDTDKVGFTPSVKFEHPGNEKEVREFKVNNINRKFIVVMKYCSGKPADLIGSLCNPCKLTPSYTGNNDGNTNEMTLAQISKGDDIKIYEGTITLEEPVSTIEAGATAVQYVADGCYQCAAGSASIASVTGGQHGAIITILGVAGQAPTVACADGKILLKDGKPFTAAEGSQLTLRAFSSNEQHELVWVEQSRYVAA